MHPLARCWPDFRRSYPCTLRASFRFVQWCLCWLNSLLLRCFRRSIKHRRPAYPKPNCTLQARATQLTADNSRRAGEQELERIRREHEENQVTFKGRTAEQQGMRKKRRWGRRGADKEGHKCAGFPVVNGQQALTHTWLDDIFTSKTWETHNVACKNRTVVFDIGIPYSLQICTPSPFCVEDIFFKLAPNGVLSGNDIGVSSM